MAKKFEKTKKYLKKIFISLALLCSVCLFSVDRLISSDLLGEEELQIDFNSRLYTQKISRAFFFPTIFRYGLTSHIELEIEFPWVIVDYYTTIQQATLGDIHLFPKIEITKFLTLIFDFNLATGSRNMIYFPFSKGNISFSFGAFFHHQIESLIINLDTSYTFQGKIGEIFLPLRLNLLDGKTYTSLFGIIDFFLTFSDEEDEDKDDILFERFDNDYFSGTICLEYVFKKIFLKPSIFSHLFLRHEDSDDSTLIIKVNSVFGIRINSLEKMDILIGYLLPWREETKTYFNEAYLFSLIVYL